MKTVRVNKDVNILDLHNFLESKDIKVVTVRGDSDLADREAVSYCAVVVLTDDQDLISAQAEIDNYREKRPKARTIDPVERENRLKKLEKL